MNGYSGREAARRMAGINRLFSWKYMQAYHCSPYQHPQQPSASVTYAPCYMITPPPPSMTWGLVCVLICFVSHDALKTSCYCISPKRCIYDKIVMYLKGIAVCYEKREFVSTVYP